MQSFQLSGWGLHPNPDHRLCPWILMRVQPQTPIISLPTMPGSALLTRTVDGVIKNTAPDVGTCFRGSQTVVSSDANLPGVILYSLLLNGPSVHALRRLKLDVNWRSTVTQQRLSNVDMCNVNLTRRTFYRSTAF